jgi:hypothetical protein
MPSFVEVARDYAKEKERMDAEKEMIEERNYTTLRNLKTEFNSYAAEFEVGVEAVHENDYVYISRPDNRSITVTINEAGLFNTETREPDAYLLDQENINNEEGLDATQVKREIIKWYDSGR